MVRAGSGAPAKVSETIAPSKVDGLASATQSKDQTEPKRALAEEIKKVVLIETTLKKLSMRCLLIKAVQLLKGHSNLAHHQT